MATTITINNRASQRVRARNCWVYRSDLVEAGGAQPGELVRVTDRRGAALGRALYSSRSQIALRFISFEDVEIDRAFWLKRLAAA